MSLWESEYLCPYFLSSINLPLHPNLLYPPAGVVSTTDVCFQHMTHGCFCVQRLTDQHSGEVSEQTQHTCCNCAAETHNSSYKPSRWDERDSRRTYEQMCVYFLRIRCVRIADSKLKVLHSLIHTFIVIFFKYIWYSYILSWPKSMLYIYYSKKKCT